MSAIVYMMFQCVWTFAILNLVGRKHITPRKQCDIVNSRLKYWVMFLYVIFFIFLNIAVQ